MKQFCGILLAVLLGIPGMAAALEENAAAIVMAKLMEAPREDAAVLMEYYPGARVSVLGEAENAYVQVHAGTQEGGLTGYIKREDLAFGEAEIRTTLGLSVHYGWHDWTLYSAPDPHSEVLCEHNDAYVNVLGEYGDWIHAQVFSAGEMVMTGFVQKSGVHMIDGGREVSFAWGVDTKPLPGEVTFETAIAFAKERLVADGERANGMGDELITAQMLENCRVSTQAYYEHDSQDLIYSVTFYYTDRTWEDGFPMLCGFVQMWVEGDQIVRYNFGNG